MSAEYYRCPDGEEIAIRDCLQQCPSGTRCMLHPTLSAIAQSTRRKLKLPSVTELIIGSREAYLKKTTGYAIDPQAQTVCPARNRRPYRRMHSMMRTFSWRSGSTERSSAARSTCTETYWEMALQLWQT